MSNKHALFSELPIANSFKSTAGAGLPSFGGRHFADLHYDTTALKEYVLTGAAGSTQSIGTPVNNQAYDAGATNFEFTFTVSGIGANNSDSVDIRLGNPQDADVGFSYGAGAGAYFADQTTLGAGITSNGTYTISATASTYTVKSASTGAVVGTHSRTSPNSVLNVVTGGNGTVSNATLLALGTLAWTPTVTLPADIDVTNLFKSTASAGLPLFGGRHYADLHFDTTALKEYVLTGVAGASASDDFNRADQNLVGSLSEVGGLTYAYGAAANIVGNQATLVTTDNALPLPVFRVPIGATGPQSVSVTTSDSPTGGSAHHPVLVLRCDTSTATGIQAFFAGGQVYLYINGQNAGQGTTGAPGPHGAQISGTNIYGSYTPVLGGEQHSYGLSVDATGLVTVTLDGVVVFDYQFTSGLPTTYGNAGYAVNSGSPGDTATFDNFSASNDGTLTWTPTVTLPADIDPPGNLFQSTVGAGLPSLLGRQTGDLHYDSTARKEYVRSGVGGTSFSDSFNRTGALSGSTPTSGAAYVSASGTAANGRTTGNMSVTEELGSTSMTSSIVAQLQDDQNGNYTTDVYVAGYRCLYQSNLGILLFGLNNAQVAQVGVGTLPLGEYEFSATYNAATKTLTASLNGHTATYVDTANTPTVTTTTLDTTGTYARSVRGSALGTLAWNPAPSNIEAVNTVTASGAAVTLPDVDTDALHRITLTANATITLPTPAAGKSITVVVVQDATGGRTLTFSTPSGTIKTAGGTAAATWAPTVTSGAGKEDIYSFLCTSTNWLGLIAGQNF